MPVYVVAFVSAERRIAVSNIAQSWTAHPRPFGSACRRAALYVVSAGTPSTHVGKSLSRTVGSFCLVIAIVGCRRRTQRIITIPICCSLRREGGNCKQQCKRD